MPSLLDWVLASAVSVGEPGRAIQKHGKVEVLWRKVSLID